MLHITVQRVAERATVTIQHLATTPAKAKKADPAQQIQPGTQGRLTYD
jgi:hypothetical protein